MKYSELISCEVNRYLTECNFTKDEEDVFRLLVKGYSIQHIAFDLNLSTATVSRRIKNIKEKVNKIDTY